MEFVLALLVILAIYMIIPRAKLPQKEALAQDTIVVEKKACPPHEWFWQEMTDQHGKSAGERIVCRVCHIHPASQTGRE
jgi:hypothetical protein